MFERLGGLKNQYEELLRRMEEPETYSDPKLYAKCEREARELQPLVAAFGAWERTEADIAAARELLDDPEMRVLAQDIVVNPIPSNYGLITYDGSTITVS